MSHDTNIQHEGGCPDCLRFEKQIDKLHGDIDQLQKWKESEIALWGDLLQYFQSEDKTIPLGASISEEALRRSKAFPELLEALKNLESANPNDSTWNYQAASDLARTLIAKYKVL